jgi:hypothetical protein
VHAEVVERGVDVSELFHDVGGVFHHGGQEGRQRLAVTGGLLAMAVLATAFHYVAFAKGTALLLSSMGGC